MITGALISFFSGLALLPMQILPIGHLPGSVTYNFGVLIEQALAWDFYVPVVTLFSGLLVVVTTQVWIFLWNALRWLVRTIRG